MLVLGFFMILVDATIVSVATPAIMQAFERYNWMPGPGDGEPSPSG